MGKGQSRQGVSLFATVNKCLTDTESMLGVRSAMGIGQSKEGFSLFAMLNKCVTAPGKRLLRLWFARPIVNLGVINDRWVKAAWKLKEGLQSRWKDLLDQLQ